MIRSESYVDTFPLQGGSSERHGGRQRATLTGICSQKWAKFLFCQHSVDWNWKYEAEGGFVDTSGTRRLLFLLTCVAGDVCARHQAAPTGAPMDWRLSILHSIFLLSTSFHLGLNCGPFVVFLLLARPLLIESINKTRRRTARRRTVRVDPPQDLDAKKREIMFECKYEFIPVRYFFASPPDQPAGVRHR